MQDGNDDEFDPIELEEPDGASSEGEYEGNIWVRGLMMIILAFMFALAEAVLGVMAVVQFLWILFSKEKNELLSDFGKDLGKWLSEVAEFQTGSTEEKPFPWKKWG